MHQDEVKGNKETSEKAAALEKMQAEMLALDVTWACWRWKRMGWSGLLVGYGFSASMAETVLVV